jgi:hypothetical protein
VTRLKVAGILEIAHAIERGVSASP